MDAAVIIVALVAVVVIVVLVLFGRRGAADKAKEAEGEGAAQPEEIGSVTAAPAEKKPGKGAAAAETAEPIVAPPKPEPVETEEEIAERVKESLAEARRMLAQLQKKAEGEADVGGLPGTMDIMTEGLEEVQALADGRKWGQARDKAEALHAQLKLMLQSARRGSSSD